jgi:hypothetical protein
VEESSVVADAVAAKPEQIFDTKVTAGEWFARRVKNRRIKNRTVYLFIYYGSLGSPYIFLKGPETWMASRGTEFIQV